MFGLLGSSSGLTLIVQTFRLGSTRWIALLEHLEGLNSGVRPGYTLFAVAARVSQNVNTTRVSSSIFRSIKATIQKHG